MQHQPADLPFESSLLPEERGTSAIDHALRRILWSQRLNPRTLGAAPATYHLASFRAYMGTHYQRVMVFPDQDEIWERL